MHSEPSSDSILRSLCSNSSSSSSGRPHLAVAAHRRKNTRDYSLFMVHIVHYCIIINILIYICTIEREMQKTQWTEWIVTKLHIIIMNLHQPFNAHIHTHTQCPLSQPTTIHLSNKWMHEWQMKKYFNCPACSSLWKHLILSLFIYIFVLFWPFVMLALALCSFAHFRTNSFELYMNGHFNIFYFFFRHRLSDVFDERFVEVFLSPCFFLLILWTNFFHFSKNLCLNFWKNCFVSTLFSSRCSRFCPAFRSSIIIIFAMLFWLFQLNILIFHNLYFYNKIFGDDFSIQQNWYFCCAMQIDEMMQNFQLIFFFHEMRHFFRFFCPVQSTCSANPENINYKIPSEMQRSWQIN